jgi:hypothetical protein
MPASLTAAGVILALQDHRGVASTGLVGVADANRLDRLDGARFTIWRPHTCRRMRIAQGTLDSSARRRRSLLFGGRGSERAICAAAVTSIGASLFVASCPTVSKATAPYGVTSNIVQAGKTFIRQEYAQAADRRQCKRSQCVCLDAEFHHRTALCRVTRLPRALVQ